jgi:hypothetical protein
MSWWDVTAWRLPRAISSCFEEYAPLLTSIRWWWRKTACHRRQTPFLNVRLDENEPTLAEVHVHRARAVGTHRRKEILGLEAVGYIVEFLAITCEEDGSGSGTIPDAYHVTLHVFKTIVCGSEGLVVATLASRDVCYRGFMPACENSVRSHGIRKHDFTDLEA